MAHDEGRPNVGQVRNQGFLGVAGRPLRQRLVLQDAALRLVFLRAAKRLFSDADTVSWVEPCESRQQLRCRRLCKEPDARLSDQAANCVRKARARHFERSVTWRERFDYQEKCAHENFEKHAGEN